MLKIRHARILNEIYDAQRLVEDAKYSYRWSERRGRVQLTEAQQEDCLIRARRKLDKASDLLDGEIDRIMVEDGR